MTASPSAANSAQREALSATSDPTLWIAHGQCPEHRGAGEAYMTMLEALGRLCRAPSGGRELIAPLTAQAPPWLAQTPGAAGEAEASLRRAPEVARRQDGSSLELQAALDLARLDHASDAPPLREAICGRFSEGLDTPDLIEAKQLLAG